MRSTNRLITVSAVVAALVLPFAACKKKDTTPEDTLPTPTPESRNYHLAFAVDPEGQSATYFLQVSDFKSGNYDFDNKGFQLASTRTARPYSSPNGQYVYSYDYLGGQVYSYKAGSGAGDYSEADRINPTAAIGSNAARFTKVGDEACLLHVVTSNTTATGIVTEGGNFVRRKSMGSFIRIGTNNSDGKLSMGSPAQFEIMLDEAEMTSGVYVSRIDAPAVANGKVYYGYARSKMNTSTYAAVNSYTPSDANILVMDYPSFANPKVIRTAKAAGNTNGYRTPVAHTNESGEVYQMVSSIGKELKILKLKDGAFDESYEFNLTSALGGDGIASNGWFYAKNGIGYIPYFKPANGAASTPNWYVARIDLVNKTAVKLNLPSNLWLQQYQNSVIKDGKFIMAIVPNDADGNFYIFDPASTSADGFEKGATIKKGGANTAYIGVF
ncbi:MAG: hypothetical protein KF900_08460 [Bacteroidetes bacterium]|nr:hypothetical protein [Bacteroidota bacterium]